MGGYGLSLLIHFLLLIAALGIRFHLQVERIEPIQVLVGRPPSGLPAIPQPIGVGVRVDAVPIPLREKMIFSRTVDRGPSLSLPGHNLGWGEKRYPSSFGDVDIPGGKGMGKPWYIEGVASGRRVVKEVIPEYPEGYQKEATIRLAFKVTPAGKVEKVVVSKKGDPLLERIAIEAFSMWRFEPIPESITQDGEITFIFRLK